MNITIGTNELKEILDLTPSNQNILLVGKHGIGKSEILTSYFEEKHIPVIPLFLGQMADPGDLIGLPYFNEQTKRTEFMPPYWFPLDDKPIALFLDELNRARPELMQSVMDLALNRRLAGKSLPKGSQIIAAVNAGDEYQVEDLDPALVSRFNVYFFSPNNKEWLSWAEKNNIDERIISFIKQNPKSLDGTNAFHDENPSRDENCFSKSPDRRAWKKVSDLIKNIESLTDRHIKIIAGIIGHSSAVNFILHARNEEKSKIKLTDFWSEGKTKFNALLVLSLNEFSDFVDKVFKTITLDINNEETKKSRAATFDEFIEWIWKAKKHEELAYTISLFSNDKYPEASEFIKANCEKAKTLMKQFIESYVEI